MKNQTVSTHKNRVDELFARISDLNQLNNGLIISQWSVYLCIRVSGLLETSIQSIYINYCEKQASSKIVNHIADRFEKYRSRNPKPNVLVELANSFDKDWGKALDAFLSENGRSEAIDSIINIRNQASHGGNTSISYHRAQDYYKRVWEVIEFIDRQCNP